MRRRILFAFEAAERVSDPEERRSWLTFIVVGGGPTGVELAGAIGEIANGTLKCNFRKFDPADACVLLLEGGDRVLPTYPRELSEKAAASLARLGVTVHTIALVNEVRGFRGYRYGFTFPIACFNAAGSTPSATARSKFCWASVSLPRRV